MTRLIDIIFKLDAYFLIIEIVILNINNNKTINSENNIYHNLFFSTRRGESSMLFVYIIGDPSGSFSVFLHFRERSRPTTGLVDSLEKIQTHISRSVKHIFFSVIINVRPRVKKVNLSVILICVYVMYLSI